MGKTLKQQTEELQDLTEKERIKTLILQTKVYLCGLQRRLEELEAMEQENHE